MVFEPQTLHTWQLQEAQIQLGEVIRQTAYEPQAIIRDGERTAVVLSAEQYDELVRPVPDLYELLQNSPFRGVALDIERDKTPMKSREFNL